MDQELWHEIVKTGGILGASVMLYLLLKLILPWWSSNRAAQPGAVPTNGTLSKMIELFSKEVALLEVQTQILKELKQVMTEQGEKADLGSTKLAIAMERQQTTGNIIGQIQEVVVETRSGVDRVATTIGGTINTKLDQIIAQRA